MSNQLFTYKNIQVTPYELTHLQTLKVVKKMNEHARLWFTGIIPEELKDSYVNQTSSQTPIKIALTDETGKPKAWFEGIVLRVNVKASRGVYYLSVEAVSYTYLLDVKTKKRSFQNPAMTYANLVKTVLSTYGKADFIDSVTNGKTLGTFIMQYEETDWQFLKRMASRFYTGLVPTTIFPLPKFFFGLPSGQDKGKLTAAHYTVHKRVGEYQSDAENKIPGINEQDYTVYEVESEQVLEVGNEVQFKNRRLVVGEAVSEIEDGLLTHTYKLFPRKGLYRKKLYNHAIIGASIQGRVIQIQNDNVRAKLDMDDQQDQSTAYWFPYSTIYTSENQTGWYVMPEVNDQIRIYFPSKKEEDGIAISSVLKEIPDAKPSAAKKSGSSGGGAAVAGGGGNDRMKDPAIKTFRTKYGKEIMLAPDKIVISAGEMSITISDQHGISIVSNQNVNITAGQEISMSGNTIHIDAQKIELIGKGNTITLEDKIELKGSEIKMN
ncbi:contractile injection system protein, VgrG/Pvc8 family [Brevibacillus agri]|uniref:contractile injection system protein, VgrG/Pvc8 family n=1 Tax=Brevibacillus agri TaxID=51101 RepID=UPI0024C05A83|nr:contractile injection system protein, VgrG/Pvc8 family [Brevibacillus agri]MED4572983.1 contractile injection system protein, VgrG/Pvc8 family [Brevibacillus agri]WHX29507.1 contractile injection system protein, VgrG/Pvc8 family [Brevibacillus agri]